MLFVAMSAILVVSGVHLPAKIEVFPRRIFVQNQKGY